MRRACLILLLAAGCRGKSEADTGEEFVEKFTSAWRRQDHDTLWDMLSAASQSIYVESAKLTLDRAKGNPAILQQMKIDYDLTGDPSTVDPATLAKLKRKKEIKDSSDNLGDARFVEERKEGATVVAVVDLPHGKRQEWALVKDRKYLRLDLAATGMRNRQVRRLAALVLLSGCHAKHESTTGAEFVEKFRLAGAPDSMTLVEIDG